MDEAPLAEPLSGNEEDPPDPRAVSSVEPVEKSTGICG